MASARQKFGSSKKNVAEQKKFVKTELENTELKPGATWNLISAKWFQLWKEKVDFDDDGAQSADADDLAEIDNSPLLDGEKLRPSLLCGDDYELLPSAVWHEIQRWYGGGPEIARRVVEEGGGEGTSRKVAKVDVYPLRIKLVVCKDNGLADPARATTVAVNRQMTVQELHELAARCFDAGAAPRRIRTWLMAGPTPQFRMEDPTKTLDWHAVDDGDSIFVEFEANGRFPRDPVSTKGVFDDKKSPPKAEDKDKAKASADKGKKNGLFSIFNPSGRSSGSSSSSSAQSPGNRRGVCGLQNLGNTCFMNSALQCLSNAVPLTQYFLDLKYKDEINRANPLGMKGRIAEEYGALMQAMWSGQHSSVAPRDLKMTIGRFAPQFIGYQQHDSHELLAFLLDGLHEDLNRITKKPYTEAKESNGRPDAVVADEAWQQHLQRNQSVVVDFFQGQLKSTVVCPTCEHVSVCFDPFQYLSLPLPYQPMASLVVTVAPYADDGATPTKYKIRVEKTAKVVGVYEAVSRVSGLDSALLTSADVQARRVFAFLREDKAVTSIRDSDQIFVYETPPDSQRLRRVQVLQKRLRTDGGPFSSNTVELVGLPFLQFFDPKTTSARKLHQMLFNRIKRFIRDDAKEGRRSTRDGATDFPFRLLVTTTTGLSCGEPYCTSPSCKGCVLKPDESLPPIFDRDGRTLCMEWDPKFFKRFVDDKELERIEEHESVKAAGADAKQTLTLDDCLTAFTTNERLAPGNAWYCPKCKVHQEAMKKFDIWKLPEVLIIQLKRFQYNKYSRDKLTIGVDFPLAGLDLSSFVLGNTGDSTLYDLFAVSNHSGGMGGGHYTAYAKNRDDGGWYLFNDSSVAPVTNANSLRSASAYVLLYRRRPKSAESSMDVEMSSSKDETR
eukprot:TRINITY_DN987_c0_g1_i1.p1 TRINITY_DN987_c0_g1~~TRINITY_DN987_c0_g1_i1.p1  ORF type:complete len:921 (-),score=331.15 TRINITY_DN987_c0_g1_i1:567-3248(-)